MHDRVAFIPASSFSLDELSDIFTRSFEEYFYPGTTTAAMLAARVRAEQIDLHRLLVMRVAEAPAGVALLGLRGERAWCGGSGVMLPFRGRGLAGGLTAAMLDQARQAGARACVLEVLTRNKRAIKTYLRAGFQPRRDLQILEWRRPERHQESRTANAASAGGMALDLAPGSPLTPAFEAAGFAEVDRQHELWIDL